VDDRVETLARRARSAGLWCTATEDLVRRVTAAIATKGPSPEWSAPESPHASPGDKNGDLGVRSAGGLDSTVGLDVRSVGGPTNRFAGSLGTQAGDMGVPAARGLHARSADLFGLARSDVCQAFPGGEIAFHAKEGDSLGSWILRGTAWFSEACVTSATLDWVEGDHLLVSVSIRNGEPFEVGEFAGRSWYLELRVPGRHPFRLDAPVS
jgi:hypothetical protein